MQTMHDRNLNSNSVDDLDTSPHMTKQGTAPEPHAPKPEPSWWRFPTDVQIKRYEVAEHNEVGKRKCTLVTRSGCRQFHFAT